MPGTIVTTLSEANPQILRKGKVMNVRFITEYNTGGKPLAAADFGLASITALFVQSAVITAGGLVCLPIYTGGALKLFGSATGAEVPDATALATPLDVKVLALGEAQQVPI